MKFLNQSCLSFWKHSYSSGSSNGFHIGNTWQNSVVLNSIGGQAAWLLWFFLTLNAINLWNMEFKSHSKSFCFHLTSLNPFNMVEVKHKLKCLAEHRGTCPLLTDHVPKCFVETVPHIFVCHQRCKWEKLWHFFFFIALNSETTLLLHILSV